MKARRSARRTGSVLALGAVLLAGCATGGGGTSSGDSSSDLAKGEKVTLRFQSLAFQDPTIAASKAIVDSWNSAHPDVQVQYVQGSWDSVHDQLVTQFQGGTAPDIIHDESADITGFAKQGYLADLTPYLSADIRKDVPEGVWKTVTVGGKVVGAPTLLQSYVVFANDTLLKKAGVTVPTGDTMTWDQFRAISKQATAGKQYGLGWGLKQPTATIMSMGLTEGAGYFTTSGDKASITIGAAELKVPQTIHDMAYVDKSIDPTSLTQGGSDVLTAFLGGKYAMTVGGNYAAQQIKETAPAGFDWSVLPLLKGTSANQAANPQTMSVSAQSKHVKQAGEFVNYFMEAKNLASVAEGDWLIPTSSGARDAVLASTGGEDGWKATLAGGDQLVQAPFQSVDAYPQWKDQIATPALQQYFGNKIDITTLQKQLADGWSQVSGG